MSNLQWIQSHIHICSEPAVIIILVEKHFLPTVLHHQILAQWVVYQVEPLRGTSYGWRTTPAPL
jgi:hypothetical protein